MRKIFILSLLLNILIISIVLGFTTKIETQNFGFRFKLPTSQNYDYGQYIFELGNRTDNYGNTLPQINIYSTNPNYYKLIIKPFWTRTLFYNLKNNNDYSLIDIRPPYPSGGNPQGKFIMYRDYPTNIKLGYLLANIESNIAFYKCEDQEWYNNNQTCLGVRGNPRYCFSDDDPNIGVVIFDGLLPIAQGDRRGADSGLTICARIKESN
jgi:hypothetical protein